jgi:hypothetical protein
MELLNPALLVAGALVFASVLAGLPVGDVPAWQGARSAVRATGGASITRIGRAVGEASNGGAAVATPDAAAGGRAER